MSKRHFRYLFRFIGSKTETHLASENVLAKDWNRENFYRIIQKF